MDELSVREREVIELLREGKRNRQIADELYIGAETVKSHLKNIYRKLGVHGRGEAVAAARRWSLAAAASTAGDSLEGVASERARGRAPQRVAS